MRNKTKKSDYSKIKLDGLRPRRVQIVECAELSVSDLRENPLSGSQAKRILGKGNSAELANLVLSSTRSA